MSKSIFIFACIFSMCVTPPKHVSVSDKSIETYAKTISSDSVKVLAIGGFYFKDQVENLYLDLEYSGILSEKVAKRQLITYIKGMISHINKDDELKPYLIKDLFGKKDVSVSLSFKSEDGASTQVHLYDGNITFSVYDKANNALHAIHTEAFAEE